MKRFFAATVILGFLLCSASLAMATQAKDVEPDPGPKDRCPVCGMFVAPFPSWLSAAVFTDGSVAYFDGPKDLFRFVFDVSKFDAPRTRDQIASLWVTEYYTTALVPAAEVNFVAGSDVLGPMGHELVPVLGDEAGQTFLKDHRGEKLLPFPEVTPAVLEALR